MTTANGFGNWPRRDEEKRQRVEAALQVLVGCGRLPPDAVHRLGDAIYRLYRQLVMRKLLAGRGRLFESRFRRDVRALAKRTEQSPDADAREHAAHMARLDTLERRNLGRGKAIEGAGVASWEDLSAKEKRQARKFLLENVLRGNKTREPTLEVGYLREVAALLERESGHKIRFNSYPGTARPKGREGRHHGPAFDLMMAAAEMADYRLTNEALAMLIRRIRRAGPPQKSSKPFPPQRFL